MPVLELFLFGALGVAIGRMTIRAESDKSAPQGRREPVQKIEAVDRLLRSIAKLIQTHLADSDAFSERLSGATNRLSQNPQAGPANEIVLALIEDNRAMRDRLANLRKRAGGVAAAGAAAARRPRAVRASRNARPGDHDREPS